MSVITSTRAEYQHVVLLRSVIIIFFLTITTLPSLHCDTATIRCTRTFDKCVDESDASRLYPTDILIATGNGIPECLCDACNNFTGALICFQQNRTKCEDDVFDSVHKYWTAWHALACSYLRDIATHYYMADRSPCFSEKKYSHCKQKYESSAFTCEDTESYLECSKAAAENCGSTNERLFAAGLYNKFKYLTKSESKEDCLDKLSESYEMSPSVTFDRDDYCKRANEKNSPAPMIVRSRIWSLLGPFLVIIGCKLRFTC